jgi:ribosome-associated toxin RatA of RatAB toxin-antitoxin module
VISFPPDVHWILATSPRCWRPDVLSTIAIDIAAPAELVFRIARDVTRWPDLLPHYVSVRPMGRLGQKGRDGEVVARMIARRPVAARFGWGIPVTWQARTWSEPDNLRLRFVHVAGATRGMDVTWRIEPTNGGCHVAIIHDFQPAWPLFAVAVDRWFTRPIAGQTLATFKALAEALADQRPPGAKSGALDSTNPPA